MLLDPSKKSTETLPKREKLSLLALRMVESPPQDEKSSIPYRERTY